MMRFWHRSIAGMLPLMLLFVFAALPASGAGKPCRPLTCKNLGYECGVWPDGCGGTIACGVCPEGTVCIEGDCEEESEEWETPECTSVTGTRAVTFTTDEGATLAETMRLMETTYTYGLRALDEANVLLATVYTNEGNTLLRSEDAGCSWSEAAELDVYSILYLTPAPGGQAYAFTTNSGQFYRFDGEALIPRTAPSNVYGLAVDPQNALHIRTGGFDCQLYESFDGGLTFSALGGPAGTGSTLIYTTEFDPRNWDHVLCGSMAPWYTTDAGETWHRSEPFDPTVSDPTFRFVFSPADPQRVWARINYQVTLNESYRVIMVSNDGGATFTTALSGGETTVDQNGVPRTLILTNQPPMAAHPALADVLYVVFGSDYQQYGTDLFRYDLGQDALEVNHTDGIWGFDSMEFSPADPSVMYLGLENVVY